MGCLAKGYITLDNVNDAYSVSLSRSSCVVKANADGSNPNLDEATTTVRVFCGSKPVAFACSIDPPSELAEVEASEDRGYSYVVRFIGIPSDSDSGHVTLHIEIADGYKTDATFSYSVVRDTNTLGWVLDWNGTATKIGDTYVMTPKMFIGKKETFEEYSESGASPVEHIKDVPGLSGVYIGPNDSGSNIGLYGFKGGNEVFSLDESGGKIGGWTIDGDGIKSASGSLEILSQGTIMALDSNGYFSWYIGEDGFASFAQGNAQFFANGDAQFSGTITSSQGEIGGWTITSNQIFNDNIGLDKLTHSIGVTQEKYVFGDTGEAPLLNNIQQSGGVAIYYTSYDDWGLVGYSYGGTNGVAVQKFALGSTNMIAGWNFDETAIWSGTKSDVPGTYTTDGITIGGEGIRGSKWCLESNGSGALAGGNISWNESGDVVISSSVKIGFDNLNDTVIDSNGVFTGSVCANNITAGTISTANITNADGTWCLNQNGSGRLAGENVIWDTNGNVSVTGTITATDGVIGGFTINNLGLCKIGTNEATFQTYSNLWNNEQDTSALYPGSLLLKQSYGENANIKIGLGRNTDPDITEYENIHKSSAAYFYRSYKQSDTTGDFFAPAIKVISNNIDCSDVGLYVKGAIVCHGGLLSNGCFQDLDVGADENNWNVLDLSLGTTIVLRGNNVTNVTFPTVYQMLSILNLVPPDPNNPNNSMFCVPVSIVAQHNNAKTIQVYGPDGGGKDWFFVYSKVTNKVSHVSLTKGDVLSVLLVYDGVYSDDGIHYFAHVLDKNS